MKKQTFYQIAISALFLLVGSLTASAQSPERLIKIQVPFDFQVAGKLLPAGEYQIKRDSQTPQILQIQSRKQKVSVAVLVNSQNTFKPQSKASVVFKGYEENHFLSGVRFSGEGLEYSLLGSKAERKLARAAKARMISQRTSTNN